MVNNLQKLTIGTYNHELAVALANTVVNQLNEINMKYTFDIKTIAQTNKGIKMPPLHPHNTKTNIERALQEKTIDVAVLHGTDLTFLEKESLMIAAVTKREDHRDVYVGRTNIPLHILGEGNVIGVSDYRSAALIKKMHSQIKTKVINGNIHKQLEQLRQGKYDGLILPMVSLKSLDLTEVATAYMDPDTYLPAVGQGTIGLICRRTDSDLIDSLRYINDEASQLSLLTEKAFVRSLGGSPEIPIGTYAEVNDKTITLRGSIMSLNGSDIIYVKTTGHDPKIVAKKAAAEAHSQGVEAVIDRAKEEILFLNSMM